VTSRGCPARCAYCTANLNCLSGHQRQSPEGVWRDISRNVSRHGITALNIEDENFTCNRDYAMDFLARKTAEYPDLRLYFMNGLDYRTLNDGLLFALRKADLLNLGLALVDADAENAELIQRPSSVEWIRSVVMKAKELGFLVTVYFIAGLPGQTKESLDGLAGFLSGLGVVIGMSVYYAVPGTRLFEKNRERFKDLTFTQMRSTALRTGSETLTAADLFSLLSRVRGLNLALKD
jgi:magnesium-protoporphyrin IX monomethyl ester (oxidative) cyclase